MTNFSDHSPCQSPQYPIDPRFSNVPPGRTPGVWTWYIVYCAAMALLYLCVVGVGLAFIVFAQEVAADGEELRDPLEAKIMGGMFLLVGGVLMLMYAVAPFLPKTKYAWYYGFVTICIGLTSACTLPACIPLLIFWLKPETKAFFNAR